MNQEKILVNDYLINYYTGQIQSDKPNLVFLHGWGNDSQVWQKAISSLANEYNCYAIDLIGFGLSDKPKKGLSLETYVELFIEFTRKLNIQNPVLIGHSFGGRVGIILSANHPETLSKLVLVDSAGIYHKKTSTKIKESIAKIVKPIFKPQFMQGIRRSIYNFIGANDYFDYPYMQEFFGIMVDIDLTPLLSKITIPTLIIWGEKDQNQYTPLEDGQLINKEVKNSKLIIIPNGSHHSFLDYPEMFEESIRNFVK